MPKPIDITAVLGSVTPPGRLRRAVSDALQRAEAAGEVRPRLVDLADQRIAFADGRPPDALDDDTPAVVETIERADAVLITTTSASSATCATCCRSSAPIPCPPRYISHRATFMTAFPASAQRASSTSC